MLLHDSPFQYRSRSVSFDEDVGVRGAVLRSLVTSVMVACFVSVSATHSPESYSRSIPNIFSNVTDCCNSVGKSPLGWLGVGGWTVGDWWKGEGFEGL